ncbi:MAG: hypothetical protein ACYTGN_09135 [Planctomycetota bacterium]|jgi:hypothetical protein
MSEQGGKARSRLDDKESRADRKKRQFERVATDGRPNGVVHVLGDIDAHGEDELRNIVRNVEERERKPGVVVLGIERDAEGLHVETESEKLAQHIADALSRSRNAEVERVFVDATKTRVLTLRLP